MKIDALLPTLAMSILSNYNVGMDRVLQNIGEWLSGNLLAESLQAFVAEKLAALGISAAAAAVVAAITLAMLGAAVWKGLGPTMVWLGIAPEPEWEKLNPDDSDQMHAAFKVRHVVVSLAKRLNEFPPAQTFDEFHAQVVRLGLFDQRARDRLNINDDALMQQAFSRKALVAGVSRQLGEAPATTPAELRDQIRRLRQL